jgi:transposase
MDIRYFIGIDISKATLDWAIFDGNKIVFQSQSTNSESGVKATVKLIRALPGFEIANSICCMEHTGIYNAHALSCLHKLGLPLWLESSLQIKQSGGLQRGKNDAVDAARIAEYAFRFRDRMRLWQPPRPAIQKLAYLSALRQRLLVARQQLQQPVVEAQGFVDKSISRQMANSCRASLRAIDIDLASVDRQISELIGQDERLSELFKLVTSVPGVGSTIAAEVFVATNERPPLRFKNINEPKKFACHAGVVPFAYASGQYKGKAKTSNKAKKQLKALLHNGAMSAIQHCSEIREYYLRKTAEPGAQWR